MFRLLLTLMLFTAANELRAVEVQIKEVLEGGQDDFLRSTIKSYQHYEGIFIIEIQDLARASWPQGIHGYTQDVEIDLLACIKGDDCDLEPGKLARASVPISKFNYSDGTSVFELSRNNLSSKSDLSNVNGAPTRDQIVDRSLIRFRESTSIQAGQRYFVFTSVPLDSTIDLFNDKTEVLPFSEKLQVAIERIKEIGGERLLDLQVEFELQASTNCENATVLYCNIARLRNDEEASELSDRALSESSLQLNYLLVDFAIRSRNDEVARLFIQRGNGSLNFPTAASLLQAAVFHDLPKTVKHLLQEHRDLVNYKFTNGLTPLGTAIARDSRKSLATLFEFGAVDAGDLYQSLYVQSELLSPDNDEVWEMSLDLEHTKPLQSILLLQNIMKGKTEWLKRFILEAPQLATELTNDSQFYATSALVRGSLQKTPELYNLVISLGLDECLLVNDYPYEDVILNEENLWFRSHYSQITQECLR